MGQDQDCGCCRCLASTKRHAYSRPQRELHETYAEKAHKGKEVTLKGDLGCGKCSFKTTKECQNILKVTEGGKETMYYLADNSTSKEHHDDVCSGTKPATVTGTVADEGKGADKKKVLTASEIKFN